MKRQEFLNDYWQYYLSIENDFIDSLRYTTLAIENYETFSIENQRLLLAIGSEVDLCLKKICGFSEDAHKNINDYKKEILKNKLMSEDNTIEVKNNKSIKVLKPFIDWPEETPDWWYSYNSVKHGRTKNYKEANLRNIFVSLAGLYLLNEYLYEIEVLSKGEQEALGPSSELFTISWKQGWIPASLRIRRSINE